jgi:hypothetical protein
MCPGPTLDGVDSPAAGSVPEGRVTSACAGRLRSRKRTYALERVWTEWLTLFRTRTGSRLCGRWPRGCSLGCPRRLTPPSFTQRVGVGSCVAGYQSHLSAPSGCRSTSVGPDNISTTSETRGAGPQPARHGASLPAICPSRLHVCFRTRGRILGRWAWSPTGPGCSKVLVRLPCTV